MTTSRYIKANAYGTGVLALALLFLCLWLLTGCAPAQQHADRIPTKVLGEQVEGIICLGESRPEPPARPSRCAWPITTPVISPTPKACGLNLGRCCVGSRAWW